MTTQTLPRMYANVGRGILIAVIAAILIVPWTFGCIHPEFHRILIGIIAIAMFAWLPLVLLNKLPRQINFQHLAPLLLLGGACVIQLVALPDSVLGVLSPTTKAVSKELLPSSREVSNGTEIVATPWSASNRISLFPAMTWKQTTWFFTVVALFLVVQTTTTGQTTRWLAIAMTINGVLLGYVTIAAFIGSELQSVAWQWEFMETTFGSFVNRNHFAFYMNLSIGCALGVWLSRFQFVNNSIDPAVFTDVRHPIWNDLRLQCVSAAIVVMFASLLICQSRGGIVSSVMAIVILSIYFRTARHGHVRRFKIAVAFLAAICATAFWIDTGMLESRVFNFLFRGDVLDVGRLDLWKQLSILCTKFPLLGSGVGTIPFIEPWTRLVPSDHLVTDAHNDYLQTLIETGLVGFSGLLLFIWIVFREGMMLAAVNGRTKTEHDTEVSRRIDNRINQDTKTGKLAAGDLKNGLEIASQSMVRIGLVYSMITAAVHGIFDFGMRMPGCAATVIVLSGCLLAARKRSHPVPVSVVPDRTPRALRLSIPRIANMFQRLAPSVNKTVIATALFAMVLTCWQHNTALHCANLQAGIADLDMQTVFGGREKRDKSINAEALTAALELYPYRLDWHLQLAELLTEQHFHDQAEQRAPPENALHLARTHLVFARDLCPLFSFAQSDLAWLANGFDSADSPDMYLRRAQLSHPTSSSLFFLSANARYMANDRANAISLWRRSLLFSKQHLPAVISLLADDKSFDTSALVQVVPNNAEVLFEAVQFIGKKELLEPSQLANVQKSWLRRANKLLQSIVLEKSNAQKIYLRAQIEEALGNDKQAFMDYGNAVALEPNRQDWRFHYANSLVSANEMEEAQKQLRRIIRMKPHEPASKLLRKISRASLGG